MTPPTVRSKLLFRLLLPAATLLSAVLATSPAMACLPEYYPEAPAPARQPGQSDGKYAGILKAHQAKLAEAERLRFEAKRLGMMKQEGLAQSN